MDLEVTSKEYPLTDNKDIERYWCEHGITDTPWQIMHTIYMFSFIMTAMHFIAVDFRQSSSEEDVKRPHHTIPK